MEKNASSKGWGKDPHGHQVKERPAHPKGSGHHDAGPERKADVKGAMEGGDRAEGAHPVGHTSLKHAVGELRSQHPHHHSAGGIHGTKDHHRHEPMHGLSVKHHR